MNGTRQSYKSPPGITIFFLVGFFYNNRTSLRFKNIEIMAGTKERISSL
jgi:hypothetical protein